MLLFNSIFNTIKDLLTHKNCILSFIISQDKNGTKRKNC